MSKLILCLLPVQTFGQRLMNLGKYLRFIAMDFYYLRPLHAKFL